MPRLLRTSQYLHHNVGLRPQVLLTTPGPLKDDIIIKAVDDFLISLDRLEIILFELEAKVIKMLLFTSARVCNVYNLYFFVIFVIGFVDILDPYMDFTKIIFN